MKSLWPHRIRWPRTVHTEKGNLSYNTATKPTLHALLGFLSLATQLGLKADQYGNFGYSTDGSTATITSYSGSVAGEAVIIIPDAITNRIPNLPVTSVGDWAFGFCISTNIAIPESVTRIGDGAFYSCQSLTGLTIPDSVTSIGDYAFQDCTSLTGIMIPSSVTRIGRGAFENCANLRTISVAAANISYSSMNGILFNQDQTTLIRYPIGSRPERYVIPATVTNIGDYAFADCYCLSNITIPGRVANIGDYAFYDCGSLSGVTIPSSVTNIGGCAFENCYSLSNITIPGSVASIGDYAFGACASLANITIPGSVTRLGDGAFTWCTNLARVTISGSVTNIGDWTFYRCTCLTNISIPCNSLARIGQWAFDGCARLTSVFLNGNAPIAMPSAFQDAYNVTVYYLPGTTNWGMSLGGRPAVLWNPKFEATAPSFGVRTNQFGFNITGTANIPIMLEACTNLGQNAWIPLQTSLLTNGSLYCSDPDWTNYPARLYRIRAP